jgi:ribonuclease HI
MTGKDQFDKLRIDMWVSGTADKEGNGGFCVLMQSMIRNREYSKTLGGYALQTTVTRMTLQAIRNGLRQVKKPSILHMYTTCAQVSSGINKYMYTWQKNDWCTSKGEEVKHVDLWKEIYDLLQEKSLGHKVHYQKSSPNQDNNMRVIHRSSEYASRAKKQILEVVAP